MRIFHLKKNRIFSPLRAVLLEVADGHRLLVELGRELIFFGWKKKFIFLKRQKYFCFNRYYPLLRWVVHYIISETNVQKQGWGPLMGVGAGCQLVNKWLVKFILYIKMSKHCFKSYLTKPTNIFFPSKSVLSNSVSYFGTPKFDQSLFDHPTPIIAIIAII